MHIKFFVEVIKLSLVYGNLILLVYEKLLYGSLVFVYRMAHYGLTGENFDEFDESKLHRQSFPINILHFNKII